MVGFVPGVRVGYLRVEADAAERTALEEPAPMIEFVCCAVREKLGRVAGLGMRSFGFYRSKNICSKASYPF